MTKLRRSRGGFLSAGCQHAVTRWVETVDGVDTTDTRNPARFAERGQRRALTRGFSIPVHFLYIQAIARQKSVIIT